jgi:glycosyltransferase involved in cell wall biosynthesis
MRILWFAPTSSQYDKGSHYYHGGGWIESLEQTFRDHSSDTLGICFFHHTDEAKRERDNVTYYPVRLAKKKNLQKLLNNWSGSVDAESYVTQFKQVIADFRPDVIQVFGTENTFAEIQQHTEIPVVIHLQGILNPYNNAFYPPGINRHDILTYLPFFKNHLLGNSLLFEKKRFERRAAKELVYFKHARNLIGRTCWDRMMATRLAPQATYFHVEEILRSSFYDASPWKVAHRDGPIQVVSTISSTIYKGLDVILKTAALLKSMGIKFEWKIVGLDASNKLVGFFERSIKSRFNDCNVSFLGVFPEKDLIRLLQSSDVFVHPSYIDNSPNSVCEAQMLGMPVISCDVGGTSSLIRNQETGLLVPANGTYEIAHGIISLAGDKKKSTLLGQQARQRAMERHNRLNTYHSLMSVYQTIYSR